jgi:5-methylcytosine-specific restriction endonuclease McrA
MPLHACVAAKAGDLERLASTERERAQVIALLPPRERNPEYEAVIRSPEWQRFADEQRLLARFKCESDGCGRRLSFELDVHHLHYLRLGRERPEDVLVLCPMCHREFDDRRRAGECVDVLVVLAGDPARRVVRWERAA